MVRHARQRTRRNYEFKGLALFVFAFDHQCHGNHLAFLDLPFEVNQHDVTTTRFKVNSLARRQVDARHGPHAHHIVFHLHFVNLDHGGNRRTRFDQPGVLRRGDLHKRPGGFLRWHRRPDPWVVHSDLRECRRHEKTEQQS
jgi:hypothetical protein